jgi:hypothetical protein
MTTTGGGDVLTTQRSIGTMLALLALPFAFACEKPRLDVTPGQFQQLQWIVGTWRGSGGNYASFFEEYRIIDDSTIGMRSFSDSTLAVVSDSSTIELRGGVIRSRSADGSYYDASEFTPTSIRFIRPGARSGGHTFFLVSDGEWTATLHPSEPQGQATVYTMRRIR